jgi:hypothetical protein
MDDLVALRNKGGSMIVESSTGERLLSKVTRGRGALRGSSRRVGAGRLMCRGGGSEALPGVAFASRRRQVGVEYVAVGLR